MSDHPELTPEEIVERIKTAGIAGMGGAGFPTFIKLCPPPTAKAECIIINGVEQTEERPDPQGGFSKYVKKYGFDLRQLLPEVLTAGDDAGIVVEQSAAVQPEQCGEKFPSGEVAKRPENGACSLIPMVLPGKSPGWSHLRRSQCRTRGRRTGACRRR